MAYRRRALEILAVVIVTACGGPGEGTGVGAGDPLADCDRRYALAPAARKSVDCFYQYAKKASANSERARIRLEKLIGESPGGPWLRFYLGNVLWGHSDLEGAEQRYREAAKLFKEKGDRTGEVEARTTLIRLLQSQPRQDWQWLWEELEILSETAQTSGDPVLRARADIREANQLLIEGRDLERAYNLLLAGETRVKTARDRDRYLGRWLETMVKTSYSLDRLQITQGYLHDWKEFLAASGRNPQQWATALHLELAVYVTLAPPSAKAGEHALELAYEALEAAREARSFENFVQVQRLLGMLEGGERGRKALEDSVERIGDLHPEIARLCRSALAVNLAAHQPEEARSQMGEVLTSARAAEDSWSLLFALEDSVKIDWKILERDHALERTQEALDAIEALRARQKGDLGRGGVFSAWMGLFELQAGRLLSGTGGVPSRLDLERAFAVLEKKRARVLLETLQASGAEDVRLPTFPSLAEVEGSLRENEAMLSYQLAYDEDLFREFVGGSWILVSTRGGTRAYRLPNLLELQEPFEGLRRLDDPGDDPGLLAYLHRQLLDKALEKLPRGIARLILVSDGALHQLPFAGLRESAKGPPLIARFELSTVPSATLWWQWRQSEDVQGSLPALILADPDMADLEEAGNHRRPDEKSKKILGSLPYARVEGQLAFRYLRGDNRLLLGAEASEHGLKEKLLQGDFGAIHFSAHAWADERFPERSAIYLSSGDGEDGLLHPEEIANLNLRGFLVVLAACDTGAGEVLRGEGTLSLARYFLKAGADSVLASHRKLPDREAAEFFASFYRLVGEGDSVQAALASAQREAREKGVSEGVWANIVLFGDGSLVLRPRTEGPRL